MQSYYDPDTGRLDAPGLGNTEASVRRDQARRTDALMAVLAREGMASPTPGTGGTPTPAPVGSGFPASGPTLSGGAQADVHHQPVRRASGAIVVVPSHNASGGKTPGTAHPFAGDIAIATGTDRFINDGPNMSYGGRDLWGEGKPNRAWVFVPNV